MPKAHTFNDQLAAADRTAIEAAAASLFMGV